MVTVKETKRETAIMKVSHRNSDDDSGSDSDRDRARSVNVTITKTMRQWLGCVFFISFYVTNMCSRNRSSGRLSASAMFIF